MESPGNFYRKNVALPVIYCEGMAFRLRQDTTYTGGAGSSRCNMMVVVEAVAGRLVVEAIGRKGVVVRLAVKRESLVEAQPDLLS